MPKYVVAEQMHASGCFRFQLVKACRKIPPLCQDRGTSIIAHRRKGKDGCGCRINF